MAAVQPVTVLQKFPVTVAVAVRLLQQFAAVPTLVKAIGVGDGTPVRHCKKVHQNKLRAWLATADLERGMDVWVGHIGILFTFKSNTR